MFLRDKDAPVTKAHEIEMISGGSRGGRGGGGGGFQPVFKYSMKMK